MDAALARPFLSAPHSLHSVRARVFHGSCRGEGTCVLTARSSGPPNSFSVGFPRRFAPWRPLNGNVVRQPTNLEDRSWVQLTTVQSCAASTPQWSAPHAARWPTSRAVTRWQGCFRARFNGSEGRDRKAVHALRFFVVRPLMRLFIVRLGSRMSRWSPHESECSNRIAVPTCCRGSCTRVSRLA